MILNSAAYMYNDVERIVPITDCLQVPGSITVWTEVVKILFLAPEGAT